MNKFNVDAVREANGCLDVLEVPVLDKSYYSFQEDLLDLYRDSSLVSEIKKKTALRQCRVILNRLLKLHDVYHMDKTNLYKYLHSIDLDENRLSIDDFIKIYEQINSYGSYISPYDLKVVFCKSDNFIDGELLSSVFDTIDGDEMKTVISFDKIKLSSVCTVVTPCVYSHEIIHSQLQSNRGIVKYYENLECLSYFIELVVAFELSVDDDVIKLMEKFCGVELIKLIEEVKTKKDDDIYDTGKYLFSIIKALKLFIIYYQGSYLERNNMLNNVQKVIDGNMYLEELLDNYSIDKKIDRGLVKHLSR